MRLLCLPVFLATLALGAQVPDVARQLARQLARQSGPLLLILAEAEAGAPQPLTLRQLVEEDGLEEVRVQSAVVSPKTPRSAEHNRALRSHLGLPAAHWALIAAGGNCVASGTKHLDAAGLKAALESAGLRTAIQNLQAFLRRNPDHLEAREKLLARLRDLADRRTRLVLAEGSHRKPLPPAEARQVVALRDTLPKPDSILTPEQDLRIWGATYLELNRAYQGDDWLAIKLPPEPPRGFLAVQPSAFPMEAASPLMKGLFRRHRAALLAKLREVPEDLNILHHWLWTSLVLEEPLIPTFEGLRTPWTDYQSLRSGKSWPGQVVQRALAAEAAANGDWTRLRRILLLRWQEGAEDRNYSRSVKAAANGEDEQWKEIGLPGLEACLRSGAPQEAGSILDGAMEARAAATFLEEAVSLARRLGRADVARAWQAWSPRSAPPERLWSQATALRSARAPGDLQIEHRPESAEGWTTLSTLVQTIRMHPEDRQRSPMAEEWRRFLGWGPHEPRWAVLDQNARILFQGFEPMDEPAMNAQLKGLNLSDPSLGYLRHMAEARTQAPENPWIRLELAATDLQNYLSAVAIAERFLGTAVDRSQQLDPKLERQLPSRLDQGILAGMAPVLDEGLWKRAGWRVNHSSPSFRNLRPSAGDETIARRWVEALETALARTPTRRCLWSLWSQWRKLLPGYPVEPFLDRLELDPLARAGMHLAWPEGPWPPEPALDALIDQAQGSGRWEAVEKRLRGLWEEQLQSAENLLGPRGQSQQASRLFGHSGLRLAHVLLSMGRPEEADRILEAALKAGLSGRREAAQLAAMNDFTALAQRWKPTATESRDSPPQP